MEGGHAPTCQPVTSVINSRRVAPALLAVGSSALLFWFGTGLASAWPLAWFAPLPVLLFAARGSWWATALVAFGSRLIGGLNMWHYFRVLQSPAVVWVIIYLTLALLFTASVSLFRALLRRHAFWSALLALSASWVSFEYLASLVSVHGTGGNLAYTQLDFLPLLQLASVTGPWGISFAVLLFPAALAVAWHLRRPEPTRARRILGVSLGAIALVLLCGAGRLASSPPSPTVRVGLVASDEPDNVNMAAEGPETGRLLRAYADQAAKLVARGATVIVLPEKLGAVSDSDPAGSDAILQSLADQTGATLVAGVIRVCPSSGLNEARVFTPRAPVRTYDKQHMLPPFESKLIPGTALTLLPESKIQGVMICKDLDFTNPSRQYGKAGAEVLLVPAWDFDLDRWSHGHMAVMRGVEDGFGIVRAAKQGNLMVSDYRGRILGEARSDAAPFATLLADVPEVRCETFYARWGDWFAWLALATAAVASMQMFRRRSIPDGSRTKASLF